MPWSRRGSMWMSLARCSNAYCHSQSTTRTTCASLASICLSAFSELDQLLEVGEPGNRRVLVRALDRFCEIVELDLVALDVERIRDDAPHLAPDDACELGLPFADVGLGGGDQRFGRIDGDRQDAKARGVGRGHHLGHRREVDLQRIDVQVFQSDTAREPLGKVLEREKRRALFPLLLGDDAQADGHCRGNSGALSSAPRPLRRSRGRRRRASRAPRQGSAGRLSPHS